MDKLTLKAGVGISLIGICIVVIGAYSKGAYMTRLSGVIVATAGLVTIGKRLYERIQEKAKGIRQ